MKTVFEELKQDSYCQHLNREEFIKKAAYYFSEINAYHPFREGNGRTLRVFFSELAHKAGYHLDWSRVDNDLYMKASIDGFHSDNQPMENVFSQITQPHQRLRTVQSDISPSQIQSNWCSLNKQ